MFKTGLLQSDERKCHCRQTAFHVIGAASIHDIVDNFSGKRRIRPCRLVAGTNHILVTGEAKHLVTLIKFRN